MRNTLATALSASILAGLSLVALPSSAQSQVVIVVGNGSGQPYYPPPYLPPLPLPLPYPQPFVHTQVLYGGGGGYPGFGYGFLRQVTATTTVAATDTPMPITMVDTIHHTDTGDGERRASLKRFANVC